MLKIKLQYYISFLGILHNDVDCIIGNGVVLSLDAFDKEVTELKESVPNCLENIYIFKIVPFILPTHIALDHAKENKREKIKLAQLEEV